MGKPLASVLQKGYFDKFFELRFSCGYRESILCHNKFSLWQIPKTRKSQRQNLC